MRKTIVVDRYGRPIDPDDDIVPDGCSVRVPMPFMDSLSARTSRAFARDSNRPLVLDLMGQPAGHRPGYLVQADQYRDYEPPDTTDDAGQLTQGEQARRRYMQRMSEAWKTETYAKAHRPRPGGLPSRDSDPDDAYENFKHRLSNAWRTNSDWNTPTNYSRDTDDTDDTDDNAEGVSTTANLPEELPLAQQHAYCEAYNKYMEENPDADEEDCDQAGRAALPGGDSANHEAIRIAAQQRYADRIANAWRQR